MRSLTPSVDFTTFGDTSCVLKSTRNLLNLDTFGELYIAMNFAILNSWAICSCNTVTVDTSFLTEIT